MTFKSHKTQDALLSMSLPKSKEEIKKNLKTGVIDVGNEVKIMKPPATKKSKLKISPSAHIKKHFDPLTTKPTPYRFRRPGGPIFEREGRIKRLVTPGDPENMKQCLRAKKKLNAAKKTPTPTPKKGRQQNTKKPPCCSKRIRLKLNSLKKMNHKR